MFDLKTSFSPKGDQLQSIEKLFLGIKKNKKAQVLLGITGSGKTFTMANVIAKAKKPTLVLAHNKTLAAQLYQEFKSFFPNNKVEYFVSYYDYYQPEAYIARTDTYIEKDLAINDNIEKMRLSATKALSEARDVIIVSSVSCIYGLGLPDYYLQMVIFLKKNQNILRDELLLRLVEINYERKDFELLRGSFRVRGNVLEIMPAENSDIAYRIEFFDNNIERICEIDPLTGKRIKIVEDISIYPASHYVTPQKIRLKAIDSIKKELDERIKFFEKEGKLIEKQRIKERTFYDIEMIKEVGFCKGIENYSRHFSGRKEGEPADCLLDYFPKDFLMFIDESHQTVFQLHAMYRGDRSRKEALVEFGFRLPSAFDNRPLKFEEVENKINQVIFVSATPGKWEIEKSNNTLVQQIIRPTGLLDPSIEIKKAEGQIDDVLEEIRKEVKKSGRILITTLTKKLSEDLTNYLIDIGIKAKYIHSDIDALQRIEIIKDLRTGIFDVLVGINLLREGLDIPEVSLVAILDADKSGFLRSEVALIQTCGRASRNVNGRVIMYGDTVTDAMKNTVFITEERRKKQIAYNKKMGIIPKTVKKAKMESLQETFGLKKDVKPLYIKDLSFDNLDKQIKKYRKKMREAAKNLDFEKAIYFRDQLKYLEGLEIIK